MYITDALRTEGHICHSICKSNVPVSPPVILRLSPFLDRVLVQLYKGTVVQTCARTVLQRESSLPVEPRGFLSFSQQHITATLNETFEGLC